MDAKRVSVDLSRALQRTAYEQLLPLRFRVYKLVPTHSTLPLGATPDPQMYICPLDVSEKAFNEWDQTQVRFASTALLEEFSAGQPGAHSDPEENWYTNDKLWHPFVLAQYPESYYAPAPSADLLKRMFGPLPSPTDVDANDDPNAGGLGISLTAMARAMEPQPFWRGRSYENGRTACHWP